MVTRLSHSSIFVLDQDSAIDFYVNKLGFALKEDVPMGPNFRWVTVVPPGQPDLEIILMPVNPSHAFDEATSAKVIELVKAGKLGAGVFECDDPYATYEDLVAKGVKFSGPPKEEFYGVATIMYDDSGNWFSFGKGK